MKMERQGELIKEAIKYRLAHVIIVPNEEKILEYSEEELISIINDEQRNIETEIEILKKMLEYIELYKSISGELEEIIADVDETPTSTNKFTTYNIKDCKPAMYDNKNPIYQPLLKNILEIFKSNSKYDEGGLVTIDELRDNLDYMFDGLKPSTKDTYLSTHLNAGIKRNWFVKVKNGEYIMGDNFNTAVKFIDGVDWDKWKVRQMYCDRRR